MFVYLRYECQDFFFKIKKLWGVKLQFKLLLEELMIREKEFNFKNKKFEEKM